MRAETIKIETLINFSLNVGDLGACTLNLIHRLEEASLDLTVKLGTLLVQLFELACLSHTLYGGAGCVE